MYVQIGRHPKMIDFCFRYNLDVNHNDKANASFLIQNGV